MHLTTMTATARHSERRQHLPLVVEWSTQPGPRSLPRRLIRPHRHLPNPVPALTHGGPRWFGMPHDRSVWLESGGYDFSLQMSRLIGDIVKRHEPLAHLDLDRLLVTVTQARSHRKYGLQAKITPLRFRHGQLTEMRRGRLFQVQRYLVDGRELFYLVTFCLPRFLNQTFEEKLVTIFHELYHISPLCNGDLRRHQGRYCLHTSSQKRYDQQMHAWATAYLRSKPEPELYSFLRLNFDQLHSCHGAVQGVTVPMPKLILVE